MRFKNILLLALLLYNACQYCWATTGDGVEKAQNVHKTGSNSDGLNIYQAKIGGQQTASPVAISTKNKHYKEQHANQTTASLSSSLPPTSPASLTASYLATSTTSSQKSTKTTKTARKSHTTPALTQTLLSSVDAHTTSNYNQNQQTSPSPMHTAFAYKAVVPTHEEEQLSHFSTAVPHSATRAYNNDGNNDSEHDGASLKKIIGSSVVTSVSVILNGEEPEFTDALGHKVPKPQPSLQVASPIDLLNPDRYEFYTFDDNGELVKRLMTLQEIQSIVANGDGEGPAIIHTAPIDERDPEKNVQDIVNSVQTVLNTHAETNKDNSSETLPVLDTPDVSSSWSMILPAIFGNTGNIIFPQEKPQQIVMTPDTELLEASTVTPTTVRTTKKPKPNKRKTGQKRKTSTTTTEMTPQIIQEDLAPHESVYTGIEQYQNIASNAQNFEGLEELNLRPLIQKVPLLQQELETTTRHIFMNNHEIIQIASSTEKSELVENFAKKPHGGLHKRPLLPHRYKTPNDGIAHSTKRPQITHDKQKIKKRPTTAIPIPERITSTTTPIPTTTTAPVPMILPPERTTISPTITTQKKKKKKPTHQPVTHHPTLTSTAHDELSIHYTKPHPHAEKRKPTHKPTTHEKPRPIHSTNQHNKHVMAQNQTAAISGVHHTTTHKKPRPTPPAHYQTETTGGIHHTTIYQKPRPTHATNQHNQHTIAHDQATEASVNYTPSNKVNHHKRPRPHKTTTTTTTTTPSPSSSPVEATSVNEDLIVQIFPGLPEETKESATIYHNFKHDGYVTPTTKRPIAYPVPAYNIHKPTLPVDELKSETHMKKKPLPSLSMIQQQLPQTEASQVNQDLNTMISYDQLMQRLKGDEVNSLHGTVVQSSKQPMLPVKYDSAEYMEKLEEMAEKNKIPVAVNPSPTTTAKVNIVTTVNPLTAHYGASTLATLLAGEENGITGRPFVADMPTESEGTDQTTINHSYEANTPVMVISHRPMYFATTRKPEESETTFEPHTVETQTQATDHPDSNTKPSATTQEMTDQAHVVKFEPLYAEDTDPIVTEVTTETPQYETSTLSYDQNEETTIQKFSDKLEAAIDDTTTSTEKGDIETVYSTQGMIRLPASVPHKVDEILTGDGESTEISPSIVDLKPHLNLALLKPTEKILMGDFQTQAATVASTLVDGTNSIAADSLNETRDEIQFLMSDVLQQMADQDQHKLVQPEIEANRLTSFAHLNSSFLMRPPQRIHSTQNTSIDSIAESTNYGQGSGTVAMDASTELIELQKHESTTDSPAAHETATIIPNKGELIKIEEAYLNSMKTQEQAGATDLPLVDEEITTFRVPIISLPQVYAQQQQDEVNMNAFYEAEREKTTEAELINTEEYQETTGEPLEPTTPPDNNMHSNKYKHDQPSDTHTEAMPLEPEENTSSESAPKENIYTTNTYENEEQPEHLENNANDGNLPNESISTESLNSASKMEVATKQATMINELFNANMSSFENKTAEQNYATMINVPSEENRPLADQIQESYISDSSYNILQQQLVQQLQNDYQTTIKPVEEHTTEGTNQKAPQSNESVSPQKETDSILDSTKSPMDLYATELKEESTVHPKYEETTVADTVNTETRHELLDELLATMYNETGLLETPEDVYIKLGESTAKPVESLKSKESPAYDVQNQHYINQSEKSDDTASLEGASKYELPPLPLEIHESDESHLKSHMTNFSEQVMHELAPNYAQYQPDDEDENDQTGYQQPISLSSTSSSTTSTTTTTTTTKPIFVSNTKRLNALKPVSYYKQPSFAMYHQAEPPKANTYTISSPQKRPMQRPAALSNLMASSTPATRAPVKLEPSPDYSKGLEVSVANLDEDLHSFARLCNELAFSYWKSITSEKISSARSLILSPFALTSMLSMVFLGARGGTSGEMNEVLKLDDMVTFNPHLVFKNITDSVEKSMDSDIATAAFVREIFSDRNNGKILQFFKEKTQQFYATHVEEVNFHVVNDIIRRRTNLLIKRHTMGKVLEYLRTNSVWVNGPLATISANLFQTDCTRASTNERDGEMFFQVHPTVRQRRLVPIPAVLYKSGFTAGYEPKLDATVVAFGRIQDTVSTIYVMPGHQSSILPSDNLERLQNDLVELAFKENAWSNILTSLMDRPGMEVQLPRFSHRSFVNASLGLQKMGLKGLFKSDFADLRGLTGSSNRDIYLSDMIQINTFSTCGEERISDHHHVEMYPAPPLRKRNKDVEAREDGEYDSSEAFIDFGSLMQDPILGRGLYDDLLDPKYLELPLPLRPRQARVPDIPRLRFDKPFLYFVRHNPTGIILFMGRFNPRLLP